MNKVPIATEAQEQRALIKWASITKIPNTEHFIKKYLVHIPNEGKREPRSGANLVTLGLTKGWPDLFLAYPAWSSFVDYDTIKRRHFKYAGLFVEMKRKGGKLTFEQDEILHMLHSIGYQCVVAYGWEEGSDAILEYLK